MDLHGLQLLALGFWATTKNVFREIGLLDERFLGGEYEDFDFGIRMKLAKLSNALAIRKRGDTSSGNRVRFGLVEWRNPRSMKFGFKKVISFIETPDISLPRKFPKSPNGFKNPEQSNAKVKANVYKNGWIVSDFLQNHEFLAKHEKKILLVENQIKFNYIEV